MAHVIVSVDALAAKQSPTKVRFPPIADIRHVAERQVFRILVSVAA